MSLFRILSATFALALISFTMACPTTKPVVPVIDASDSAVLGDVQQSSCHLAFVRLQQFACPEADAHDAGDSFEQICLRGQQTHEFDLHPDCIAGAASVDDLRARCNVVCRR